MYDLIIIGMGISGISAAIYAKRNNLNVLVIEKDSPGGLLNKINVVNNYPGYKEISGPELAYKLFEHFNDNNITYKIETVNNIELVNDYKKVITNNNEYLAKYIIIATGRIPKKIGLENEDKLYGKGISTCAICDGNLYKEKDVCVVGGGNSALEEAIYLANIVDKVYLIHRRNEFSAEKELINKVNEMKNIEIKYNSNITKINELDNKLASVEINKNEILEVSGLFEYVGYKPNCSFASSLDILDDDGYIIVNEDYETKIDGIYAVGDSIKKHYYQLVLAASDGVTAAINIINKKNTF